MRSSHGIEVKSLFVSDVKEMLVLYFKRFQACVVDARFTPFALEFVYF